MADDDDKGATVFIVDDDAAVRDSLTVLLEAYGLFVSAHDSIAAFKQAYRPRRRACLILDQHMPSATGLDFLASPEGRTLALPAIMITGQSDREIRDQALDMGVFAFLTKPVVAEKLISAVGRAIARGASPRRQDEGEPDHGL
jgi:FixJ family two-component response regulator